MKRAGIVGLGLWVPETVRRNDAWSEEFVRSFHDHREQRRKTDFTDHERHASDRAYDELYTKYAMPYEDDPFKGTVARRVQDGEIPCSVGDTIAAARALLDAHVRADEIDLVLASALPADKLCPSNAPAIAHGLGCRDVATVGFETYCASAIAQLDFAAGLVETGRARYVLCVQSHQLARINDLRLPFSPLFGDATGAILVGEVPADRGLVHVLRGGDPSLRNGVALSFLEKPGAVWWKGGIPGPIVPGSDDLDAARTVARNLLRYPIETLRELSTATDVPLDAVSAVATIQPTIWFQPAISEALQMASSRFPSTYVELAHIGGASIPANLLEARRAGMLRDGAHVALYGHGAGFTRYAALLRWHEPRKR
jgi:3-oxoacyl-[acyl-carrier-protein] synthase-3